MKTCSKCKALKLAPEFTSNKARKSGLADWCRSCSARYKREQYQKDPEKYRAKSRRRRETLPPEKRALDKRRYELKYEYGLSKTNYDTLVTGQQGKCAICLKSKKLVVDHCHTTSLVRGLLCYRCNTLTGFIESEHQERERILKYLASPPAPKLLASSVTIAPVLDPEEGQK